MQYNAPTKHLHPDICKQLHPWHCWSIARITTAHHECDHICLTFVPSLMPPPVSSSPSTTSDVPVLFCCCVWLVSRILWDPQLTQSCGLLPRWDNVTEFGLAVYHHDHREGPPNLNFPGINCCNQNLVCTDISPSPVRVPTLVGVAQKLSSNKLCTLLCVVRSYSLRKWIVAMVGGCFMNFCYWLTLKIGKWN